MVTPRKPKKTLEELREANHRRLERRRQWNLEWRKNNRDKVNAYRQAKKAKDAAKNEPVVPEGPKVKSAYHADWHGSVYTCPELTYRGLA